MIEGPIILLLLAAAIAIVVVFAAFVFFDAVVLWLRRLRGGSVNPQAREDTLLSLGYAPAGPGKWSRPVKGSSLLFEELPDGGWRWLVRMNRYNTLTLQVEERSSGAQLPKIFSTEVPAIDARFLVSSPLASQTLALVTAPKVNNAMLAMPYLSLRLEADELILEDPDLQCLRTLLKAEPRIGADKANLEAEFETHQAAATLVTAILGTLYSRLTGTLLPEHR